MKRLDRYLLISLLQPFFFCLVTFFSLWIIIDLFNNIQDLISAQAPPWFFIQYYGIQIPRIAQTVLPPAFFLSCVYLLAYMSSRRELVATMAAGVSLARIFVPFLAVSLLVAALQYFLYFDLTPSSRQRLSNLESKMKNIPARADVYDRVLYKNPSNGTMWFLTEVNATEGTFRQAEILSIDELGRDKEKLFVARGTYKNGYWDLYNVRKVIFRPDGTTGPPVDLDQLDALTLTESPQQLVATRRKPEEYGWADLHAFTHAKYRASPTAWPPTTSNIIHA
ncbi:MAG: YjgP/YjgQ family permease [Bdellovibrionaceae bacterium]|nr:YjgP/YjgQ family permease [Pseudobdellovibrionaceae bacterium]